MWRCNRHINEFGVLYGFSQHHKFNRLDESGDKPASPNARHHHLRQCDAFTSIHACVENHSIRSERAGHRVGQIGDLERIAGNDHAIWFLYGPFERCHRHGDRDEQC